MDRNREARRAGVISASLSRRRHRISSLRDSPEAEDDGPVELQEPSRLRVRGLKKDRDRDLDRDRDRERDQERERSSRTKRRRAAERLIQRSNTNDDDGDDSSEQSVNDDEEDDDDGAVGMLPPDNNHYHENNHNNNIQQHRTCFPPAVTAGKVLRAAPVWKSGDEMIGVSVPRKARSASTKRSHEWISGSDCGVSGERQIYQQASALPLRTALLSTSMPSPAAHLSPSSSNASVRKKMVKPNGSKVRPPKSSSKSSTNPEELEIEIAEVLFGLTTQSQDPVKKETLSTEFDSREVNKSQNDAKSSISSPTSNSQSTTPQPSSIFAQISGSLTAPISAVAPKRKRPRQVSDTTGSHGVQSTLLSSSIAITAKTEGDQIPNADPPSSDSKFEGSKCENGGASCVLGNLVSSQSLPLSQDSMKSETESTMKLRAEVAAVENADVVRAIEEVVASPKKESTVGRLDDNHKDAPATDVARNQVVTEIDNKKGEKFEIDLMVPPPFSRSSPERKEEIDLPVADDKPMVSDVDNEMRPVIKEKEDIVRNIGKDEAANLEYDETTKEVVEEAERHKLTGSKGKNLQLDLEKPDVHTCSSHKLQQQVPRQEQQIQKSSKEARTEKPGLSSTLPLPMTMASWPGGLPPVGYMAPLRGVVSMDGSTVSPASMQPLFSQPRPNRCATHFYIARNIHHLQQFTKMNSFWPAAAGPASLFGAKPCNVNADLQGNVAGRGVNPIQDKTQNLMFPGSNVKDKGYQANFSDGTQRKPQILLQQALPPVVPNNLLHGPTFIFPLNQQQAALTAASIRPGSTMSSGTTGNSVSSSTSTSTCVNASTTTAGAVTALSFNYPTIPANESQYLAILQNNAYPCPIPAVGAPQNYRGAHAQTMSFFNGSIHSPQMIHQSQHQQPHSQPQQIHQSYPNTSIISSSSSSSQKHKQSQQQKSQVGGLSSGGGSGNLHNFTASQNRLLQPVHSQQKQHFPSAKKSCQQESEVGGDSPSTTDSRASCATANAYGQNFVMPAHTQNFTLIASPATLTGAVTNSASGNTNEGKQVLQPSSRAGVESLPPQTFAPFNNSTGAANIDFSSMAQNHAILQGLPEATRQFMAAAAAAQKHFFRICEEGKSTSTDSSNPGEERKGLAGMTPPNIGKSVASSRPDSTRSAIPGNSIIDSSAQPMKFTPGRAPKSNSSIPDPISTINSPSFQLQAQPQQIIELHRQQQQQQQQQYAVAAASRNKTSATCNGSAYSENFSSSSSSMATNFPSALSGFPQSGISSPTESSQWRNSNKTSPSHQVPTSLASPATPSLKNIPHQQLRGQQIQMQISFGANQKVEMPQGQNSPGNSQSISAAKLVGSPTSSISKGANGIPKIGSSSTSNKASQASAVVSQQAKNSQSVSSLRSSPVSGRNISSIIGNPQTTPSSSTGTRPWQQQLPKNMQQAHVFFSPYMQTQPPYSASTSFTGSATGGYYLQRRQPELQQQPQHGSSAPSLTGVVSLCPSVSVASSGCMDPTKTMATASNMKGGFLPGGIIQPVQLTASAPGLLPTGFSYVPTTSAAAPVKPAEQKRPADE